MAVFGHLEYASTEAHILSAGLRFSTVAVELPTTSVSSAASIDVRKVSGDLGWVMNLNDDWQVMANVGLGFRSPNIFDLGTLGNRPGNRINIPNTELESERVLHADVGVRRKNDRTQLEVMLYSLRYDDRITSVLTGDVTMDGRDVVQSINAAESSIHGIEAGLKLQVSNSVDLNAVINYTWGEQQVTGEYTEPGDRIPPLTGSLTVGFNPGGTYRLEGWLRFADGQDRLSERDIRDTRISPDGTPGWAVLGTMAYYYIDDWQLAVGIDNLLDKHYRVHGSGLDEPGRNVSLSVRRTWQ
jgi:outer membrane receptor protein involved in Fe transport